MNVLPFPPFLPRLALWLLLAVTSVVMVTKAYSLLRAEALPTLPEYTIELGLPSSAQAAWQAVTLTSLRLPSEAPLELSLRPLKPVKGPVVLHAFTRTSTGAIKKWSPGSAEVQDDGTIRLRTALPPAAEGLNQLTFLVTRPDKGVSAEALSRSSANQRLLHLSVLQDRSNHAR